MTKNNEIFQYPEEVKARLDETDDLEFRDGRRVSPEEIWHFLSEEGPRRFPHAFSTSQYYGGRISNDTGLLSAVKRNYLQLSAKDRLLDAHNKGVPIVLVQGGQNMDPYYAAGGIPLRPGFVMRQAQHKEEGLDLRKADLRSQSILETGRRTISIEACHQISAHAAADEEIVPIDLIAPYLSLRCSDMAYLVESHRHGKKNIPLYLVDYPVNRQHEKEWAVEYLATMLHTLTQKIGALSGKEVSDEVLKEEIKFLNTGRKLAREYNELWLSAKVPPTNSTDHRSFVGLGQDYNGDEVAAIQILKEGYKETKERVKHSVKGNGLSDDPARIFICGSCVGPNPNHVDRAGGVVVGRDDGWSVVNVDVKETGDPYQNLSRAILSFPYELPTEERAIWTAQEAKESRADGLIFMYNWGCNYQTAVGRMIADIVKENTGIPSINIDVGELGRMEAPEQSENRVESFIEMLR